MLLLSGETYVNRKLPAEPLQLCRVCDKSAGTADMRLLHIDGLGSEPIQDHQIIRKHIRTLIIFGGNILGNGVG